LPWVSHLDMIAIQQDLRIGERGPLNSARTVPRTVRNPRQTQHWQIPPAVRLQPRGTGHRPCSVISVSPATFSRRATSTPVQSCRWRAPGAPGAAPTKAKWSEASQIFGLPVFAPARPAAGDALPYPLEGLVVCPPRETRADQPRPVQDVVHQSKRVACERIVQASGRVHRKGQERCSTNPDRGRSARSTTFRPKRHLLLLASSTSCLRPRFRLAFDG
jgi:hypothetical protein